MNATEKHTPGAIRAAEIITGDKYINGAQLAKRLGIGASTLSRWVKAGKLPKPKKGISGMLLFERAVVDRLGH